MKNEKAHRTLLICPPHTPFAAATVICLWGRSVDIIKFQVNRFIGFGADPPPFTSVYALTCYNVMMNIEYLQSLGQ